MPRITVRPHPALCPDGASFDVRSGSFLCDMLVKNGIALEHACEKSCACSTCHVIVDKDWYMRLPKARREENDMLDLAPRVTRTSRSGCQIKLTDELDGLTVRLP